MFPKHCVHSVGVVVPMLELVLELVLVDLDLDGAGVSVVVLGSLWVWLVVK